MNGSDTWCIQTNDPRIKKNLSRRSEFHLSAWGCNHIMGMFKTHYKTRKEARRGFERMVDSEAEKDRVTGYYLAKTTADVGKQNEVLTI